MERFLRTQMLLGSEAMDKLRESEVMVFGLGGVGSYVAEALARCGVGRLTLIDGDIVDATNINRQLIALPSTVGRAKADVAKERMLAINPDIRVTAVNLFVDAQTVAGGVPWTADYVVDAIDTVASKLAIIERCDALGIRIISSMGAGNKLHPERFRVADISETAVCPLAKVMRKKLRERGISVKVCYSDEEPVTPVDTDVSPGRRSPPGSVSFVPSVAGLMIAGQVVRDLLEIP